MQATVGNELRRLLDQSRWANREWIEFVHVQAVPETRPRELLAHIVMTDRVWCERIDGEQSTQNTFPLLSREALVQVLEENHQRFERFIEARPEDVIHFKRASGVTYHARVIDIIHQVLSHGYHHRGQLAAHYARLGVTFPNTDHINYLVVKEL